MRRALLRFLAVPLLLLALIAAGVLGYRTRAEAYRLLTNPTETRMRPTRTPGHFGLPYRAISVRTPDGLTLTGWWVPSRNGAAVIAQHGYKGSRGEMLNEAAMLHRRGYGVLLSTLRAHDESEGDVITFGRLEMDDLAAWYDFVRSDPGVEPARIGLLGNSLGGTLAIQFAARTPGIAAVVAHSPFSSLPDTLETSVRFFTGLPPYPFAPMIAFWAERLADIRLEDVDARPWIAQLSPRAVFLLQGGADVVVSPDGGQRLFEAAGHPKELWFDPKVGHAAFDGVRALEYERRVGAFFDRYLRSDGIH